MKHPKFAGEAERRVAVLYQASEHSQLIFRQKRTLLARHLPIDLAFEGPDGIRRLPITRICIGPGPGQKVSRISVGDLLVQCGYEKDISVELSRVPYRVP